MTQVQERGASTAARRNRSRLRIAAWCAAAFAVLFAVALLLVGNPPTGRGYLSADSGEQRGAHALVELLRQRGVEVTSAGTIDAVRAATQPGTQLLVVDRGYLSVDAARALRDIDADLLLVEPTAATRALLTPDTRTSSFITGALTEPGCDLREATRAGSVGFDGAAAYSGPTGSIRCYDGALLRFSERGRSLTLLGSGQPLMNGALAHDGSASLAMNLAGRSPRLVWFRPDLTATGGSGPSSIESLYPAGIGVALVQIIVALVLLAWWQGRRLGQVVTERIPVVVRASETTEGRARMYQAYSARDSAAAALRDGTRHRVGVRLGFDAGTAPGTVVALVAERTGRSQRDVHELLYGQAPSHNNELTELARRLDGLERQVLGQ